MAKAIGCRILPTGLSDGVEGYLRTSIGAFVSSILNNEEPFITLRETRYVQEIIEAQDLHGAWHAGLAYPGRVSGRVEGGGEKGLEERI